MKKTVYIDGMHCISCEILLTKQLNEINGVKVIDISHKTWKLMLELKTQNHFSKIKKAIFDLDYTIKGENEVLSKKDISCEISWKKKTLWIQIGAIFAIWGLVFLLLRNIDIYSYFPGLSNNASIGVALLMGFVASLSTCLAVTGSVVLGFGEYIDDSKGWLWHLRVQWSFHIWRILWFFLLWWILGLLWQVFKMSISVNATLTIIVGIVLFYMGLHMLGLVPSITKFGFHLPKTWTKSIFNIKNPLFAPVIWALTFFLPCGFTQSMQLVAMSSGNFWQGWFVMAMFALWTMPILLGVGLWSSYIKDHKFGMVNKIIWALIVFFGIFSISNGWTLLWFNGSLDNEENNYNYTQEKQIKIETKKEYETIRVWHNWWSLEPESVQLDVGKNYELIILPTSNGVGCMSTMIIPKISRKVNRIIEWQEIIYKIDGLKKWTYPVVCGSMGMYQWELVVN